MERLKKRLLAFKAYDPAYISVTYGAGGSTRGNTAELSSYIQDELAVTAMSHLTCVGHPRSELRGVIRHFKELGVANIMALRGDPPRDETEFCPPEDGLSHATDLISMIQEEDDFCVGCAGYPEGHIEAASLESDIDYVKAKIDAGASFIVTQFFLDNVYFYRYRDLLYRKGIDVPLLAGILPITNYEKQLSRFAFMCGCTIPARVMKGLYGKSEEDQAKYGLEHAAFQISDLMKHEPDGIHLYALNKQSAVETLAPLVGKG